MLSHSTGRGLPDHMQVNLDACTYRHTCWRLADLGTRRCVNTISLTVPERSALVIGGRSLNSSPSASKIRGRATRPRSLTNANANGSIGTTGRAAERSIWMHPGSATAAPWLGLEYKCPQIGPTDSVSLGFDGACGLKTGIRDISEQVARPTMVTLLTIPSFSVISGKKHKPPLEKRSFVFSSEAVLNQEMDNSESHVGRGPNVRRGCQICGSYAVEKKGKKGGAHRPSCWMDAHRKRLAG